MSNGIADLKRINFFSSLTDDELQTLLDIARRIEFEVNQHIIRQGENHSTLYIVLEGVLHVHRQAGDMQVFLGRLEKGSFFGEIGLFDPGPATATVRGLSKGALYQMAREDFLGFLARKPEIGCKLMKTIIQEMAKRLRRVDQRLMDSVYWGENLRR